MNKLNQVIRIFTYFVVVISLMYSIIPIFLLQGDYVHTIHDGLDSFGGTVQYIYENRLLLRLNQGIDFSTADLEYHYYGISYDVYTVLNCAFGFLIGQQITRIAGTIIGFFSFHKLLCFLFRNRTVIQQCCILLMSAAYVVTPIASNRMFAFATLPLVILLYLKLRETNHFHNLCLLSFLIPVFSEFSTVLFFVIGFWFMFTVMHWINKKKINMNLIVSLVLMIISTIIVNRYMFVKILGDNSRGLTKLNGSFVTLFRDYLLNGQYHSTGLHGLIILPVLLAATAWLIGYFFKMREKIDRDYINCLRIIIFGWLLWVLSAFLLAIREAGFQTGFALIDGFSWGRLIGFMRPLWYVMLAAFLVYQPKESLLGNNVIGVLIGIILAVIIWYGMRSILGTNLTQTFLKWNTVTFVVQTFFFIYSALIFSSHKYDQVITLILLCIQIGYVMFSMTQYNDTGYTLFARIKHDSSNSSITLNEFYDRPLFEQIKEDVAYKEEMVCAYGFHPAVLNYNGFHTLDRYDSVHSMKIQSQFREIILPALELYPKHKTYYDEWGGRMYLFGELSYAPTRDKNTVSTPLYIDTNAFKKYGGRYILSRAEISNADELGLSFVNDYDLENSLYHIYLYRAD